MNYTSIGRRWDDAYWESIGGHKGMSGDWSWELYIDADGRKWLHPPHYGVYGPKDQRPMITLDNPHAAGAIVDALNDHVVPKWLGPFEVREIKGIEVVDNPPLAQAQAQAQAGVQTERGEAPNDRPD